MALRWLCPGILLTYSLITANLQEPFPQGFSMGNQGTVLWENGSQGCQPWISAAYCDSSRKFGMALGAVSYYDRMDNFIDESIYRAFGGVFWSIKRIRFKLAVSHFSALEMYYEQAGFLSAGVDLFSHFRAGIDFCGIRTGLNGYKQKKRTVGECAFSAWFPFKAAALGLSLNHINLKSGRVQGVDAPLVIKSGFHTVSNRMGAQGVIIEITPSRVHPVRFILGEQYRLFNIVAIEASLANNPFLIGIGVLVDVSSISVSVSVVNHPVLGWSRGFSALYSSLNEDSLIK